LRPKRTSQKQKQLTAILETTVPELVAGSFAALRLAVPTNTMTNGTLAVKQTQVERKKIKSLEDSSKYGQRSKAPSLSFVFRSFDL
jgi:hypothetical protein